MTTLTDEQELLAKFLEFADADYVPNSLFDRARALLSASKPAAQDEREQAFREATKPRPETSGVGEYCQPGDRREPRWIVMYDDADRSLSIFEDEQDARDCFANSEAMGWNCWLFSPTPRAASPAAPAQSLDDTDYEALEREHLGDAEKRTGIYAQKSAVVLDEERATTREVIEPLTEPVSISKALLAGRMARVGGNEKETTAFLVNIQIAPWGSPKDWVEGYVDGFNRAAKWMQSALTARAASPQGKE